MSKKFDFRMVTCRAYLQKVNDGVCIVHIEAKYAQDNQDHYILRQQRDDEEEVESPCEGANDLEKRYFRRKEANFTGVIVGEKEVVVTGHLGVDTNYDPYSGYGVETCFIFKKPNEVIRCGVVYFANNRKRYVPLEDIDFTEEVKDNG